MHNYHRVWAEVNLDAIRANMESFRDNVPKEAMLCGVIKTDGYGLGAVPVAKTIDDLVWGYAVATIDEALNLRRHNITKPILVLGYVHPERFADLVDHKIRYAGFEEDKIMLLSETAKKMGKKAGRRYKDMHNYHRVWAEVNLDAIRANMESFRDNVPKEAMLCGVIKTDGYGLGAVPVAKTIDDLVWGYAVATIDEALNLRRHNITKPILVLGYVHPERFADLVDHKIRYAGFEEDKIMLLSETAKKMGKKAYVHVKVDTGMSRIGMTPEHALSFVKWLSTQENICTEGIFTHMATADMIKNQGAIEQQKRFQKIVESLKEAGCCPPICHCANSAAGIWMTNAPGNMFRIGISLYGYYPSEEVRKDIVSLTPALTLKSEIAYIKTVPTGTAIGYGATFVTDHETVVATIPIGYGDGYPRALSNKGSILIHGKKAPILGRICMDQTMVDISDIPEAKEGDEVVVIGKSGDNELSAEEVSELAGSFNYELLCDLGKRIPRVYYRHGKVVGSKDYNEDDYCDFM